MMLQTCQPICDRKPDKLAQIHSVYQTGPAAQKSNNQLQAQSDQKYSDDERNIRSFHQCWGTVPHSGARAPVSFPSSFFSLRLEADEKLSSFTFFPISTRVPNYVDSSKRRLVTRGERKSGEGDKHTCGRSECSEISGAFWQRVEHFKKHQAARTSARQPYFTAWIKAESSIYNQERAPLYSFL